MILPELESFPSAERDLPEGWVSCVMRDVAIVVGGGTPKADDPANFSGSGHPWITPADLSNYQSIYISRGRRDLSAIGLRSSSAVLLPKGSVLFSSRAPIGYVAVASTELSTNQGFRSFVCQGGVLPEYIYFYLKFAKPLAEEMASGTTFPEISGTNAGRIPLLLPPLAEQRRIVAKVEELLASVNAVRERFARTAKLLKRFRQSVLAAACSGRLTADWRAENPDGEPASALLARILREKNPPRPPVPARSSPPGGAKSQQSLALMEREALAPPVAGGGGGSENLTFNERVTADDLPELPEEWCWTNFGSVISELRNGVSVKPEMTPPGNPMLRINAVRPGKVIFDDVRFLRNHDELIKTYRLQNDDLLFTRYNGSLDLLGVCGMVRGLHSQPLLYPDKLMRVRFDHSNIIPAYAEMFFQAPSTRLRVTAKSKSSAGQQGVSGEDIKSQAFAIPPLAEQQEIVRRVERLFTLADAIEKRVAEAAARADKLTQAVLAKAFRGELVPTEAELARQEGRGYEPASALLARGKKPTPSLPKRKGEDDASRLSLSE